MKIWPVLKNKPGNLTVHSYWRHFETDRRLLLPGNEF